jgi:hypothetical protein
MNMNRQLNLHHSRKTNHQANRTDLFDGDLKLFKGDHQVDGIGTNIDIKGVETFKLEDDDGQVHAISVPSSVYFLFLKKVLLTSHHQAKANHGMTSRPRSIWTATHGDFIIHHWNQGKAERTVKMSKSTNNPTVGSTSETKNYRAYSETIEALQACTPSAKREQFLQRPVQYEHLTDSDDDNSLLRYHQDGKKGVKQVLADDQTVWTCNTVSNASKETTDMHKIGRDGLLNFDNCQESSKSRYKQRFKVTVADIKSTLQQLWGKNEGDLDGDLSQPGQATHQVAAQAHRIKSIHPNGPARQGHLESIVPGYFADQDYSHITMLNLTATRSRPLQLPATSRQYMFFEALPTRQQYYNDHLNNLTSFIDLTTIREITHTNDFAKIVSCATTKSKGLRRFRLRRRCRETWRECACGCVYEQYCDVARVISLATTRLRKIRIATLKVTIARRNPSSHNIVQVSVDAFTSWYILDLMVVKEDIEEYTLSTTEDEYVALSMSLRDVLPIVFLLDEMKCKNFQVICTVPHVYCKIFEDNSGSLKLALLPKLRPRTKHINVCCNHFREHVRSRKVRIFPIGTKDQTAYDFTKALPQNTFIQHLKSMCGQ